MKLIDLKIMLILPVLGIFVFTGCSSKDINKPKAVEGECIIAGELAPNWACGSYSEKDKYIAVGSAPISKLGHGFSRKEALSIARANLIEQIQVEIKSKTESYMRSTGLPDQEMAERVVTQVTKQISNITLRDSKQISYWENKGDNSIYLLVAMSKSKIDQTLTTEIKKSVDEAVAISQQQENSKKALNNL